MGVSFKQIAATAVGFALGGIGGAAVGFQATKKKKPQGPAPESQADTLAREEKETLEARRKAIAGLTQTSSLGAGTPQTARKSVLGV